MMPHRSLSTALALVLAAPVLSAQTDPAAPPTAPAAAAASAAPDTPRAKLMALDTDGDRKWSKAEWIAGGRRERGFERMDTDKDGMLTQEEVKAGVAQRRAMRDR